MRFVHRKSFKLLGAGALLCLLFLSAGCEQAGTGVAKPSTDFNEIEWTDLIPAAELEALMNPPDYLSQIVDGSSEDQIDSQIQTTFEEAPQSAYDMALVSTNVVEDFDDQNIKLPGFIVPLEFDENFVLTEFFLVPYFGACLHTPPPPPNQIIFVKHPDGFALESIEQPYWISGLLTTDSETNDMAHAAYSMTAMNISPYEIYDQVLED